MTRILAGIGLLLASGAVAAAILGGFPYWYTPFTVGSFLCFDYGSERLAHRSVLRYLAHGHWRLGVVIYLVAAAAAVVVDVIYGRGLADAWAYPPWHGLANIAVPVLFHYPFGFLSLYATFQTVRGRLGVAGGTSGRDPGRGAYGRVSLVTLALCLVLPLINFWFNANLEEGRLLLVVMLVATVAIDGTREALTGDSMLRQLIGYGRRYAAAVVITLAWAILINEGPNVFAHEWVYLTDPFGLPLWLVLVLGWPFLLVASTTVYETAVALAPQPRPHPARRDLGYTGSV